MLPFLHERLRALHRLLARNSEVLAKHNRLDLDLAGALEAFLDEAAQGYRTLNRASAENEMLALKAQCITARHGVNPATLERVSQHRREMQRAVGLRALQHSAEQLRADIAQDTQRLEEGRAQLRPIVLLAWQQGLLDSTAAPPDQTALAQLWRSLLATPQAALAARQVALQLGAFDIQLLLAELLAALRE